MEEEVRRAVLRGGSQNWERVRPLEELSEVVEHLVSKFAEPLHREEINGLKRKYREIDFEKIDSYFEADGDTEMEEGEVDPLDDFRKDYLRIQMNFSRVKDSFESLVSEAEEKRHTEMFKRRYKKIKFVEPEPKPVQICYNGRTLDCHRCFVKGRGKCVAKTPHAICKKCNTQGTTVSYHLGANQFRTKCYGCDDDDFHTF